MRWFLFLVCCSPYILLSQSPQASDLYGEGVRAFYAGDYETAVQKYSAALALRPNTEGYLYNRGLAYLKLDLDSSAAADFHQVLMADSNYADAWYQIGMLKMDQKEYDRALVFFNHALRIDPKDIKSLHQLGLLYYYKRRSQDAIGVYDRILTLDSTDGQAYYKRGLAELNLEDLDGAVEDFSETFRLDPENTLALEQRATTYLKLNDLDNACRDWNMLLDRKNPRAQGMVSTYCGKQ